jgi:hypothetical protein
MRKIGVPGVAADVVEDGVIARVDVHVLRHVIHLDEPASIGSYSQIIVSGTCDRRTGVQHTHMM